jgi:hypothetical protein
MRRSGRCCPVTFDIVQRETLRYNPKNAVTEIVERVTDAQGTRRVHKRLRRPAAEPGPAGDLWAASMSPRDWNYWRREAEVYSGDDVRDSLRGTGLDLAGAEVTEDEAGISLWLEDVAGTPGVDFALDDHRAFSVGLGRWQAAGPVDWPWQSRGFLRRYSDRPVDHHSIVADDEAWAQPLVRDTLPDGLREGWQRLLAHRDHLLDVMESLPRTSGHLDLWVSNEHRRPTGEVVLFDWAFAGDAAIGEDLGNHIPDAAFDLFWPAERLAELEDACLDGYLQGLREGGWSGPASSARLGMVASCVKYTWLLPAMLRAARNTSHRAYHRDVDAYQLYQQRGLALAHLVRWCDEALRTTGR